MNGVEDDHQVSVPQKMFFVEEVQCIISVQTIEPVMGCPVGDLNSDDS